LSLRSFIEAEKAIPGNFLEFEDEVSPTYEAPALMKDHDGGPVVMFRKVSGSEFAVAGGLCGNRDRIFRAIGTDREGYYKSLIDAVNRPIPPKIVEEGPVNEVREKPDLDKLPAFLHYEKDAGRYITAGLVIARGTDGKFQNASMHRLLVLGKDRLAIRIVPRHLYALHEEAKKRGEDLQVAIAIGLHPAVLVGANAGPKFGVDELGVGNALLGGRLEVVKCKHVSVTVPAEAEIVLEGVIKCDEEVPEGPFVDLTGTYDIVRKQPVVEVVSMMRRKGAIFQSILPGGAEHKLLMGLPKEARMYDAISRAVPEVRGVRLTLGGSCWFHAVVSIKKQSEGDGKNALMAAFGSNPSVKHVVVVDEDIDVDNMEEVEWAIATRVQGDGDIIIVKGARGSTLDPSSDQVRYLTSKVGIDATIPWDKPREKFERARIPPRDRQGRTKG